jgi:hypothetical protein
MTGLLSMGTHGLLRIVHDWDRLACLMARLHYVRFAEAVPRDLQGQAAYWKKYYNTVAGKGTPKKYMNDWAALIQPHV